MPDEFQPLTPTSIKFRLDGDVSFVGLAIAASPKRMRVRYFDGAIKREVEIPKCNVLPLKQATVAFKSNQRDVICSAIARLEREREVLQRGAIAPEDCWIEVRGRSRRQAWWRSHLPIFGEQAKSWLIGAEGSVEHEEAKRQRHRRDRLKQIEQDLQRLQSFGTV
jgi:hypothetical protein